MSNNKTLTNLNRGKMIKALTLSLLLVTQSTKVISDSEWQLISKAVYKCGQIKADKEWIYVIEASKSTVKFTIDKTKSDRDWQENKCDDVLHIAQVTK